MSERIIKKYPNRRLYDTDVSRYVTLEDIRNLVRRGERFRVVEAKSEEDITRTILLQIILEQEEKGPPIFTTDLLQKIIGSYGDTMQGFMSSYLQESLDFFIKQQKAMQQQMNSMMQNAPMSIFGRFAQSNVEMWKAMQESWKKGYQADSPAATATGEEKSGSGEKDR